MVSRSCYLSISFQKSYPVIIFNISFVNVIMIPPARVRNPLARCDGSWLLRDSPTCMMPSPSSIRPIALIRLKIKFERLFTTDIGSPAAKHVLQNMVPAMTRTI